MSAAVLPLPPPVVPYSHHALPPSKKPSKRKHSRSRPSILAEQKSSGRKNPSLLLNPDSQILNSRVFRKNSHKSDSRDLVMEEVRILKRGEALRPVSPSSTDSVENPSPYFTVHLGPDPVVLPVSPSSTNIVENPKPSFTDRLGSDLVVLSVSLSSTDIIENPTPCLTDRLGPDPVALPKPSVSVYAGPAFVSSPSPSSLPVPLFLKKAASRWEDIGTRSLRCFLRLDASL